MHQRRLFLRAATILIVVAGTVTLVAHDVSTSESSITLTVDRSRVDVRLTLNVVGLPNVDANQDMRVSYEEMDMAIERVFGAVKQHFVLRGPDPPTRIVAARCDIVDDHVLRIDMQYSFERPVTRLDVSSTLDRLLGPSHHHYVSARINGAVHHTVLDARTPASSFPIGGVTFARVMIVVTAAGALAAFVVVRAWRRRTASSNE